MTAVIQMIRFVERVSMRPHLVYKKREARGKRQDETREKNVTQAT